MLKKRVVAGLMSGLLMLSTFTGCELTVSAEEETSTSMMEALSQVTSCETSIGFEMQARIGTSASSDGHTASIGSEITISSTLDPFSYHGEYYSFILVDGVRTREDKEFYVAQEDDEYVVYEYQAETDEWFRSTLTRAEALALPLKTGLIQDWESFFSNFELYSENETVEGRNVNVFTGEIPTSLIQELIGEKIFGSFLYSMEQLLNDTIPCELYVDTETYLPTRLVLDFSDEFIVSDMLIDSALIEVNYSKWNEFSEIEVPKKVSIVASDPDTEFYATYFAWNLFLPYINSGIDENPSGSGSGDISFISSWDTFQVRIDQGMTSLPLVYEDLKKLGYTIDDHYSSNILEPNSVINSVPVYKGQDKIYCSFYNPETEPKPISDCFIGSIDISASNLPQNGISIFLPGEVTLGITREALFSAYGDPDETSSGFAADTYLWKGNTENQSFMAEVSPSTGFVIRICLKNIPLAS